MSYAVVNARDNVGSEDHSDPNVQSVNIYKSEDVSQYDFIRENVKPDDVTSTQKANMEEHGGDSSL